MIIDPTDFNDRPYKVPNQPESRDFKAFIEYVEERLAMGTLPDETVRLLGVELWEAFSAGLATSGTIEARWLALRDGGNYTYSSKTYRYGGWVDMIRPAIFSRWIPMTTDKLTNIGFIKNNAPQQSKLTEDYYPSMVQYWNEMVKKVGFQTHNCYNYENSFYGFMKANADDYPEWSFVSPHLKNRHDI